MCQVTPKDFDISKLKMEYYSLKSNTTDMDYPGVDITSVTKDTQMPGKWNVAIGSVGKDGKPYTPKPKYSYKMNATVDFSAFKPDGYPVHSDKFTFSLDIQPSL